MPNKKKPSKGKKKASAPRRTKRKPAEPVGEVSTSSDAQSYSFVADFDPTATPDPLVGSAATSSVQFTVHSVDLLPSSESIQRKIGNSLRGLLRRLRSLCGRGGEEEQSV